MRNKLPQLEPGIKYSTKPFGKRLKYSNRRYLSKKRISKTHKDLMRRKRRKKSQTLSTLDVYAEIFVWLSIWGILTIILWVIIVIIGPLIGSWIFKTIFTNVRVKRFHLGGHLEMPAIFVISFILTYLIWWKSDSNLKSVMKRH